MFCIRYFLIALLVSTPLLAQQTTIKTETKLVLVDVVVTDKKGNYIRDLALRDFHVFEDNKEQQLKSFYFGTDPAAPANSQKRYLVLFFDNSSMDMASQARARDAAVQFVQANANDNSMIAVVNYSGALQISQNFTNDVDRLKTVVSGRKLAVPTTMVASTGAPALTRTQNMFGARNMVLALRGLAKDLSAVPGRKMLVLLSSGFPLNQQMLSEVNAAIDACNRANVAIYAIDTRGLNVPGPNIGVPGAPGEPGLPRVPGGPGAQVLRQPAGLSSFVRLAAFEPGQGRPSLPPAPPSGGATPNPGAGGTRPAPSPPPYQPNPGNPNPNPNMGNRGGFNNNPNTMNPTIPNRPIMPLPPEFATPNEQVLFMLANGTGGFVITNTNDFTSGFQKIGKEQNEFYVVSYTPPETPEASCHVLKVKVDRGGTQVRARSGYCNAKGKDMLAGTPVEVELESRVAAEQPGNITASMALPFFYTAANVARVNLAMEIPADKFEFQKTKGKFNATLNVLGIAYAKDGAIAGRFSDAVKLDLDDKKEVEAFKSKPYHYENQFDLASGEYNLKVVFASTRENFGKIERALVIDQYDPKNFFISGLAFSKEVRRLSDLGAQLDTTLIEDRTPLILGGVQVVPTGVTFYTKSESAYVYFEVYEPLLVSPDPKSEFAVAVQMRVLDRKTGEQKHDTGLMRVELPPAGTPVIPVGRKLAFPEVGPGQYSLEVSAVDSAGKGIKRTLNFEVN